MARLPVGVVDQDVEGRHRPEIVQPGLPQREVVLVRVGVDEQLDRPRAVRSIAEDGRGDGRPPQGLRQHERRDLPSAQGSQREVPQRRLALPRLVHDTSGPAPVADLAQERVIGRARQESQEAKPPSLQEVPEVTR